MYLEELTHGKRVEFDIERSVPVIQTPRLKQASGWSQPDPMQWCGTRCTRPSR